MVFILSQQQSSQGFRQNRPPSAAGERPRTTFSEESKSLATDKKHMRDKLFGIQGKPPTQPEVQPHPYLNVQLAESVSSKEHEKSARAQTPLVVPEPQKEQFMPPMVFPSEAKSVFAVGVTQGFVPGVSRRQKTKMLSKPGTAGGERPPEQMVSLMPEVKRPPTEPEEKEKPNEPEDELDLEEDLPLESKEPKKVKGKPLVKEEEEEEDFFIGTAYKPTIAEKPKSRPHTPSVTGSAKELPESRKVKESPKYSKESEKVSVSGTPVRAPEPPSVPPRAVGTTEPYEAANKKLTEEVAECNKRIQDLLANLDKIETENSQLKSENETLRKDRESSKVEETKLVKDAQRELLEKHHEELEKVKTEHLNELRRLQESHAKSTTLLEKDRERALELERKSWEREKTRLNEMHKLDMENLEKQHKQNMDTLKRQLEFENEAVKNQLQRETELSKLTTQVDSLMATMRAKLEEEMKDRVQALEERETALEENRRKLELERVKMEVEKKRIEDTERMYKDKERQLRQEVDEQKKLYEYQRDSLEGQHQQLLSEISERREQLMLEKKQLDLERAQLEKVRRNWEGQCTEERMSISLEKKLIAKQKEEFNAQMDEQTANVNAKMVALDAKREQIAKEEGELQRRQQAWMEKELQLRREYDELQLKIDKYCYEKRQVDAEKERLEKLALQVEEESRVIYKYKSTIDKTRQELEQMRAEVDTKESILRTEKAKVDQAQKEMQLKQRALESVQTQYLKDQANRPLTSIASPRKIEMGSTFNRRQDEERLHKLSQVRRSVARPVMDSFKASDFIQELEKDFGRQPRFVDYIVGEKNLLLKSKQDLGEKLAQSNLFAHSRDIYQASDRKENLASSLLGANRDLGRYGTTLIQSHQQEIWKKDQSRKRMNNYFSFNIQKCITQRIMSIIFNYEVYLQYKNSSLVMGSACGVKSANAAVVSQPSRAEVKENTDSNVIDTEIDGIPLRKACIGHYFFGRDYNNVCHCKKVMEKWKEACSPSIRKSETSTEPLFIHRKGIFVDDGLSEIEAENNLIVFSESKPGEFSQMLSAGPPPRYRWIAWKVALKVKAIRVIGMYDKLRKKKTPWAQDIEKDLNRTFPTHPLFAEGAFSHKGKKALKNILLAYAVYNKHVGYCQGMNFIAAFLLIVSGFQEEDVFWVIVSLTRYKLFPDPLKIEGIEGLYSERFPLLRALQRLFDHVLRDTLPALKEHMESIDFSKELWLQKWISTVFLYSFPKGYCVRLWDFILGQGVSHIFTLTLAVLRHLKGRLLGQDFIGCYELLKGLQTEGAPLPPPDELVAAASKIRLDWTKLNVLFMKYQEEVEREDFEERKRKLEKEKREHEDNLRKQEDNPQDTERQLKVEDLIVENNKEVFPEIKRIHKRREEHEGLDGKSILLPPINNERKTKFVFECNSAILAEGELEQKDIGVMNCSLVSGNAKKGKRRKNVKTIIRLNPVSVPKEHKKYKPLPKKSKSKCAYEEEIKSARMEDEDSLVFSSSGHKTLHFLNNGRCSDRPLNELKGKNPRLGKVIFIQY
eukprot:TRINITY_DN39_c0_g1_i8.p1 TRINITY_DN39_c0_g1~~TRINITY_DN39_c0_g1_i8.p1  ORF type:complete len:1537 (-),score=275.86 TRINITY_DN39_c0_g1_i8:771-5381(-)